MDRPSARLLPRAEAALRSGDHAQAERVLRRVLMTEPMNSKANEMLGYIAALRGDGEEARRRLEKATASAEASREAWYLLGRHLQQRGDVRGAANAFSRAVAIDPRFFEAAHDLALSLTEAGDLDAAIAQFDRAIALQSRSTEAWYNRGRVLGLSRRYEDALASYDKALECDPRRASSWSNRGVVLLDLDRSEEALASFDRALEIAPDHGDALVGRGLALYDLRRDEEALSSYARALEIRPRDPEIEWRASFAHLARGDLEAGWDLHERRWSRAGAGPRGPEEIATWSGEDLHGKRVLAWAEQGYGDTLHFCRYVELLLRDGAAVVLQAPAALGSLLSRSFPECTVISREQIAGAFDFQIPLMSLPRVYRTNLESIPSRVPYLRADADRIASWRAKLGNRPAGIRVGIACSGNPEQRRNRARSVPLAELAALADHASLFLLQPNIEAADRAWLLENPGRVTEVHAIGDFDDAAALVECMDAIVTIDTALAHLAGALAKPTRILLAPDADWRWLRERDDTPWYPSSRLFRRSPGEEWREVVARVAASLALSGA